MHFAARQVLSTNQAALHCETVVCLCSSNHVTVLPAVKRSAIAPRSHNMDCMAGRKRKSGVAGDGSAPGSVAKKSRASASPAPPGP